MKFCFDEIRNPEKQYDLAFVNEIFNGIQRVCNISKAQSVTWMKRIYFRLNDASSVTNNDLSLVRIQKLYREEFYLKFQQGPAALAMFIKGLSTYPVQDKSDALQVEFGGCSESILEKYSKKARHHRWMWNLIRTEF